MFQLTSKTIDIFRTFKFKNLKYFNTHNGIAYSCELYHNKTKIADVRNDGDGGMTHIDYTESGESVLGKLNLKQYHSKDLGFNIDNEYIIADLIELAISIKKSLTKQSKSIVYLKGENICMYSYKRTLSDISKINKDIIKKHINEITNNGGIILNTNFNKIGI
ncbi:MAG: hypothetical protein ACOC3V_02225 [bacterium]